MRIAAYFIDDNDAIYDAATNTLVSEVTMSSGTYSGSWYINGGSGTDVDNYISADSVQHLPADTGYFDVSELSALVITQYFRLEQESVLKGNIVEVSITSGYVGMDEQFELNVMYRDSNGYLIDYTGPVKLWAYDTYAGNIPWLLPTSNTVIFPTMTSGELDITAELLVQLGHISPVRIFAEIEGEVGYVDAPLTFKQDMEQTLTFADQLCQVRAVRLQILQQVMNLEQYIREIAPQHVEQNAILVQEARAFIRGVEQVLQTMDLEQYATTQDEIAVQEILQSLSMTQVLVKYARVALMQVAQDINITQTVAVMDANLAYFVVTGDNTLAKLSSVTFNFEARDTNDDIYPLNDYVNVSVTELDGAPATDVSLVPTIVEMVNGRYSNVQSFFVSGSWEASRNVLVRVSYNGIAGVREVTLYYSETPPPVKTVRIALTQTLYSNHEARVATQTNKIYLAHVEQTITAIDEARCIIPAEGDHGLKLTVWSYTGFYGDPAYVRWSSPFVMAVEILNNYGERLNVNGTYNLALYNMDDTGASEVLWRSSGTVTAGYGRLLQQVSGADNSINKHLKLVATFDTYTDTNELWVLNSTSPAADTLRMWQHIKLYCLDHFVLHGPNAMCWGEPTTYSINAVDNLNLLYQGENIGVATDLWHEVLDEKVGTEAIDPYLHVIPTAGYLFAQLTPINGSGRCSRRLVAYRGSRTGFKNVQVMDLMTNTDDLTTTTEVTKSVVRFDHVEIKSYYDASHETEITSYQYVGCTARPWDPNATFHIRVRLLDNYGNVLPVNTNISIKFINPSTPYRDTGLSTFERRACYMGSVYGSNGPYNSTDPSANGDYSQFKLYQDGVELTTIPIVNGECEIFDVYIGMRTYLTPVFTGTGVGRTDPDYIGLLAFGVPFNGVYMPGGNYLLAYYNATEWFSAPINLLPPFYRLYSITGCGNNSTSRQSVYSNDPYEDSLARVGTARHLQSTITPHDVNYNTTASTAVYQTTATDNYDKTGDKQWERMHKYLYLAGKTSTVVCSTNYHRAIGQYTRTGTSPGSTEVVPPNTVLEYPDSYNSTKRAALSSVLLDADISITQGGAQFGDYMESELPIASWPSLRRFYNYEDGKITIPLFMDNIATAYIGGPGNYYQYRGYRTFIITDAIRQYAQVLRFTYGCTGRRDINYGGGYYDTTRYGPGITSPSYRLRIKSISYNMTPQEFYEYGTVSGQPGYPNRKWTENMPEHSTIYRDGYSRNVAGESTYASYVEVDEFNNDGSNMIITSNNKTAFGSKELSTSMLGYPGQVTVLIIGGMFDVSEDYFMEQRELFVPWSGWNNGAVPADQKIFKLWLGPMEVDA